MALAMRVASAGHRIEDGTLLDPPQESANCPTLDPVDLTSG